MPEITFLFWVVKILTTAGGEATSDYLKRFGNVRGGRAEVALFVIGFILQLGTRRYWAIAYWFFAFAIAIFGTVSRLLLHLDVGISAYAGTTLLWAIVLAAVFVVWYSLEGTLPSTASPPDGGRCSTGRSSSQRLLSGLPSAT